MTTEIPQYHFVWQQGEDGEINLVYKSGEPAVEVDLTGYSLRMDVCRPGGSAPIYTFNSDDEDALTQDEAVLNADGSINITISRTYSLPGGAMFDSIGQTLNYDIFLRDTADKQKKILRGTIKYEESQTLWL